MSNDQKIKAGDIIEYPSGRREYVFRTIGEDAEPAVNACNESWIERGLRLYGQELYPIRVLDMDGVVVVDHYGDGLLDDGRRWYKKYISDLAEPNMAGWYVSADGRYVLVFDGPDQPLPWSYGSADDITIGDQFAEFDHEFLTHGFRFGGISRPSASR